MIKMEKTYGCLRAPVLHKGKQIGTLHALYMTQWFVSNKYRFTGTFNKFVPCLESIDTLEPGDVVDVLLPDKKVLVKNVFIEWIRKDPGSGTFNAEKIVDSEEE